MHRNPDIRAIVDLTREHLHIDDPFALTEKVGEILHDFYRSSSDKPVIDHLPLPLIDALEDHFANLISDIRDICPDLNA